MAVVIEDLQYSIAGRPFEGEEVSGDLGVVWSMDSNPGFVYAALVDVLGHGNEAYKLACRIREYIELTREGDLVLWVTALHKYIRGERGCAGSFCKWDLAKSLVSHVGVGNTRTKIIGNNQKSFIPRSGVIGYLLPSLREETCPVAKTDFLIMYSDGVSEHFDLDDCYPQLKPEEYTVDSLVNSIIKCFGKENDDSICLAMQLKK